MQKSCSLWMERPRKGRKKDRKAATNKAGKRSKKNIRSQEHAKKDEEDEDDEELDDEEEGKCTGGNVRSRMLQAIVTKASSPTAVYRGSRMCCMSVLGYGERAS